MVAGSEAQGLYNILQETRIQPEPSTSVGLPLPIRCRGAPTAMVLSPTAKGYSPRPDSPTRVWGGHVGTWQSSLICPPFHRSQYTCCNGIYACQHKWLSVGLLLLGWGVPWGTLIFSCCHLHPCATNPSGHKTDMSFLSCNFLLIPMP